MRLRAVAVLALLFATSALADDGACDRREQFTLAIHGGAGSISGAPEPFRKVILEEAPAFMRGLLARGGDALAQGATSLDVVEAMLAAMEDSGLFDAGKGSFTNRAGNVEMDAAIMDGRTRNAGAVAAVRTLQNPIAAARIVMEQSDHVLLVGPEADAFAVAKGAAGVEPSYFEPLVPAPVVGGTVGAVALDRCGDLAAATSTGGLPQKTPGRVGDSPIIGAGTYADNRTVAVSATGQGEYFMRLVLAHDISAMTEYQELTLEEAVARAIHQKLTSSGGSGAVIAINARGQSAAAFNTEIMLRGVVALDHDAEVDVD